MNTAEAKRRAFQAAKDHGVTIEYEVGHRHWTVNVCAPEGKVFDGGEHSLVTEWMTKPDARFWMDVKEDIIANAPYLIPE